MIQHTPILANETDLLHITQDHISPPVTSGDHRLRISYDDLPENLILDIHLYFEERLQEALESSGALLTDIKTVVNAIQTEITFESLGPDGRNEAQTGGATPLIIPKAKRLAHIIEIIADRAKVRDQVVKAYIGFLKKHGWQVDTNIHKRSDELNQLDHKVKKNVNQLKDYINLYKILMTQFPYLSGSVEYAEGQTQKLEYWLYHMSTLIKDPARVITSEPLDNLPKSIEDYRTDGQGVAGYLIPFFNQRNLSIGMLEARWDELPEIIRNRMARHIQQMSHHYQALLKHQHEILNDCKTLEKELQNGINEWDYPTLWHTEKRQECIQFLHDLQTFNNVYCNDSHTSKLAHLHACIEDILELGKNIEHIRESILLHGYPAPQEVRQAIERYVTHHQIESVFRLRHVIDVLKRSDELHRLTLLNGQHTTLDIQKTLDNDWRTLNQDQKKKLYGEILGICFSRAHVHEDMKAFVDECHLQALLDADDDRVLPCHIHPGFANVVGVRGQLLETPQRAKQRYIGDWTDRDAKGEMRISHDKIPILKRLRVVDQHILYRASPEMGATMTDPEEGLTALADEFEHKLEAWYRQCHHHYKPIMGGISGHTLAYLNLYGEANQAGQARVSMERLRACMLAGLIGNKHLHSYDEVMTASHGMPYRKGSQGKLRYAHPAGYDDVLASPDSVIKSLAVSARRATLRYPDQAERHTVYQEMVKSLLPKDHAQLMKAVATYIGGGFKNPEAFLKEVRTILGHASPKAAPHSSQAVKTEADKGERHPPPSAADTAPAPAVEPSLESNR